MREIKFRVWDKALKEYMTLKEYQNLHAIEVETDGTLILSPRYRFMDSMMIQVDAFDVQQYTGLHDKNGKEIYEGDIIDDGYNKGVVKYGRYNCTCCDGIYGWYINNEVDIRSVEKFCKVIGNIYENSDLLKGADNIE